MVYIRFLTIKPSKSNGLEESKVCCVARSLSFDNIDSLINGKFISTSYF